MPNPFTDRGFETMDVIREILEKQECIYKLNNRKVVNRIVNISKPYVPPLKLGKVQYDTECGANLNCTEKGGLVKCD